MMVTNSQQQIGIMTGGRHTTVLRCMAGVGGGIAGAPWPILMGCTTTHPVPQIILGFGGKIGTVIVIPSKQQL